MHTLTAAIYIANIALNLKFIHKLSHFRIPSNNVSVFLSFTLLFMEISNEMLKKLVWHRFKCYRNNLS